MALPALKIEPIRRPLLVPMRRRITAARNPLGMPAILRGPLRSPAIIGGGIIGGNRNSGGGGSLTVEDTDGNHASSVTSLTLSVTTASSDCGLILYCAPNGAVVNNISSTNTSWNTSYRARSPGTGNSLFLFYGKTTSSLSGETITISLSATASFVTAMILAVSGVDTTTVFSTMVDSNASLPATGTSSTPSGLSTTADDTLIHYGLKLNSSGGAPPAGWTDWFSRTSAFMGCGYQIFNSAQSSIGAADTGSVFSWVADAVKLG